MWQRVRRFTNYISHSHPDPLGVLLLVFECLLEEDKALLIRDGRVWRARKRQTQQEIDMADNSRGNYK